jgi:hypothetical protein
MNNHAIYLYEQPIFFRHMLTLEKGDFAPAVALKTCISQLFQLDAGVKIHTSSPPSPFRLRTVATGNRGDSRPWLT